jgi:hypothetical protein
MGLLAAVVLGIGYLNWTQGRPLRVTWALTEVLVLLAIMVMGGAVNGRLEGVLIDSRNRISLSKFQVLLWTVVVLSSLIAAAAFNITHFEGGAPLDIAIPNELLGAMGISAISFVASPALLQLKANQETTETGLALAQDKLNLAPGQAGATGQLFRLCSPQLASWTDMFLGDDVGNVGSADISKVQQFSITLLLVGIYIGSVWALFTHATPQTGVTALPALSSGFVMLMAISHASYLAYKVVPHERAGAKPEEHDPRLDPVG